MEQTITVHTTTSNLITVTSAAKVKILELINHPRNHNLNLRIYVDGGCCSGFQYYFSFEAKEEGDHTLLKEPELEIIADPVSVRYLVGVTLDYISDEVKSGFSIINPKLKKECGCTHSSCNSCC